MKINHLIKIIDSAEINEAAPKVFRSNRVPGVSGTSAADVANQVKQGPQTTAPAVKQTQQAPQVQQPTGPKGPGIGQKIAQAAPKVGSGIVKATKWTGDLASQIAGGVGQTAGALGGGLVKGYKTARQGGGFAQQPTLATAQATPVSQTAPAVQQPAATSNPNKQAQDAIAKLQSDLAKLSKLLK